MPLIVDIDEAKTRLSQLLDRVAQGEDVVIARAGRPVARLVPVARRSEPRVPGGWRGRVEIAPDFDELPPEIAAAFQGSVRASCPSEVSSQSERG